MFKKWGHNGSKNRKDGDNADQESKTPETISQQSNTILKGSRLTGDINVTCDLELGGEIQGNIRSDKDSNIVIRGICNGNVETKDGSVTIDGELRSGNITAGKDVTISGRFAGGEIHAKNTVILDGAFSGRIVANEIEIGPRASGKGELFYRESISVSKGAKVEVQISQSQKELKLVKPLPVEKIKKIKLPVQDISEIN